MLSEVNLLEEDVTDGEAGLVRLRNTLSEVDLRMVEAQGRASRILDETREWEALIEDLERDGYTSSADVEELKAEVRSLEDEVKKLRQAAEEDSGNSARTFVGEGNRQYLTGLNLGGRHIAILLDVSSSMLADKLVNIIRLRNMDDSLQRGAEKWSRALNTVDWLTAQLPVNSNYQVITFNTTAKPALAGTANKWLEVANQVQLEESHWQLAQDYPQRRHQPGERLCCPAATVTPAGQYLPADRRTAHTGHNRTTGPQRQWSATARNTIGPQCGNCPGTCRSTLSWHPWRATRWRPRSSGSWPRSVAALS